VKTLSSRPRPCSPKTSVSDANCSRDKPSDYRRLRARGTALHGLARDVNFSLFSQPTLAERVAMALIAPVAGATLLTLVGVSNY
jgi:hypothetical protein